MTRLQCLDDPGFKPKSRNEIKPFVITLEKALELARKGQPEPEVE